MSKQSCGTPEPKADCHSKCRSSPTRTLIIVLPLWSLRADKLTFHDLLFLTPSKSRAQCFQDSSRITLHTDPLVIHMDLHILLYWSSNRIRLGSEVKNLQSRSPELQNYDQLPEVDCPAHYLVLRCGFHSMEQSPTGTANSSSPSQEISSILRSPKVNHRVHNSLPPVHTLSQKDSVHVLSPLTI